MHDFDDIRHESLNIGPVPLIRRFFDRLDLEKIIEQFVRPKGRGRKPKISPARVLCLMITNVLFSRLPLYGVSRWLRGHVVDHFGFETNEIECINDDRIARALDNLYDADRASLMTAVVTKAVREFEIDLKQLHSDTTTVTFSGDYKDQQPKEDVDRPPLITFGYNKDHRPDLKQLVYSLAISADGAVPIHYKCYDGNVTDDKTHIETWSLLRDLVGHAAFVYVADSKLCTRENMGFIDREGGGFVTVLIKNRKEDQWFRQHVLTHRIPWEEVRREKNPRRQDGPDSVYRGYESPVRSSEGYRIIWYHSSVKEGLDQTDRQARIMRARERMEDLQYRAFGRRGFKTEESALAAADAVLREAGATRWLKVRAVRTQREQFKQVSPGRPGRNTQYKKVGKYYFLYLVDEKKEEMKADAKCDGLFPLITNLKDPSCREVLDVYKYQPFLEKRNEQLKSVLSVAPVLLKRPDRVASLLFLYFLALVVFALIERELRRKMAENKIRSLPLYPEARTCENPTTEVVFQSLEGQRRHRLVDQEGDVLKTYYDKLSPVAKRVLVLLGVDTRAYGCERTPRA